MKTTCIVMLAEDFKDFIRLLNLHKVTYMVVGGYALAFHGTPVTWIAGSGY